MRLINADALIANHFSDNHNIALSYANKLWMRKIINEEDTVDPIHAAGGCYCKECKYHEDEVYPDSEWELHDHQECWCNWWDSVMPLNGFCSEGRKDDNT